ncbi:Ldh family oxidoreductase [Candidatus Woesearchaeota archaeon]|jgi:L-2-hydroxycarboxylate dehydrogenase (NAD+)|nr:Ldh family oxidoreductase [Candidatus Woesearchaeota archaeon]
MKIQIEEIKSLCIQVLNKLGYNQEDAETIIAEYMYGELSGKKSHGLSAFPGIVKKTNKNILKWEIEKEDASYALINGNGNIGQLVGKFAMELAIKKASKTGIAIIGIHHMQSYLMPGYYSKLASDNNMIGIVVDNAKSRVAPHGGIEPKLGTNPLGLGIPTGNINYNLDMATSVRAMGEVRLAKKLGKEVPKGMAMDKNGNPTRNPDEVNSLNSFGTYKGYALNLAIEMLAGSLVRAKMGSKIQNSLDRGFLFIVINPQIFVGLNTFKKETGELLNEIKHSKTQKNVEEIFIPNEHAESNITAHTQSGEIEIEKKIFEDIKKLL